MNAALTDIAFAPYVPWWAIGAMGAVGLALLVLGAVRRARGVGWRLAVLACLLLALANPALVEEEREPQRDVALVVVDGSPSQAIAERAKATETALAGVLDRLSHLPNLDVRTVRAGAPRGGGLVEDGTRLFGAIADAVSDIPKSRLAGTIVITDGQVHDVPATEPGGARHPALEAPLHALLTGAPDEGDRRIEIVNAPAYGMVAGEIGLAFRVDDLGPPTNDRRAARIAVRRDGKVERTLTATPGREETVRFTLEHAGPTVFELEVEPGPRELTLVNNRAVAIVQGVRDRLRVLLISGEPHAGERVWRNLLKSDPAVDLVHFTILRPPEKQDATPIRELSLIAFPIRELFEVKLGEFDLIIFDRYERRGVIPQLYLANVARYVRNGGALLEAVGPGFAQASATLARTPLGDVLPGEPTGNIIEGPFRAALTPVGTRHPVTADLASQAATWGRWLRQMDAEPRSGESLLTGAQQRPLLVLDRVGEGRVAQLFSDQIWLWSRGYEGGGPQAELLRRLAHWLMKEPELEENALTAQVRGSQLEIARHSLEAGPVQATVTSPSGKVTPVTLEDVGGGRAAGVLTIDEAGLYTVTDGVRTVLTAAGPPNPLEFADVRATPARLDPAVTASGGGIRWIRDGLPDLREVRPGQTAEGRGWLGLRANRDYVVTGVRELPLLPPVLVLLAIGATLVLAWWREAK